MLGQDELRSALQDVAYANKVLDTLRFAGLDQNPKGIRDLLGGVESRLRQIQRMNGTK